MMTLRLYSLPLFNFQDLVLLFGWMFLSLSEFVVGVPICGVEVYQDILDK